MGRQQETLDEGLRGRCRGHISHCKNVRRRHGHSLPLGLSAARSTFWLVGNRGDKRRAREREKRLAESQRRRTVDGSSSGAAKPKLKPDAARVLPPRRRAITAPVSGGQSFDFGRYTGPPPVVVASEVLDMPMGIDQRELVLRKVGVVPALTMVAGLFADVDLAAITDSRSDVRHRRNDPRANHRPDQELPTPRTAQRPPKEKALNPKCRFRAIPMS